MIEVRDKVEHLLSKDWLVVLEVKDDKLVCRDKRLSIVEVYDWEVKVVTKTRI